MSVVDDAKALAARLPEIYKAVVAGGAVIVAQEGTVLAVLDGHLPAAWVHGVVVGFGLLSGGLTWLKRNKPSVDQLNDLVKSNQTAVEAIIAQYKAQNPK